jgi:hypothetical protein
MCLQDNAAAKPAHITVPANSNRSRETVGGKK